MTPARARAQIEPEGSQDDREHSTSVLALQPALRSRACMRAFGSDRWAQTALKVKELARLPSDNAGARCTSTSGPDEAKLNSSRS